MKTKIIFLAALVCSMMFATSAFADSETGFYEKDHIRGFISFGADYRGMFSEFKKYVNQTAFVNGYHVETETVTNADGVEEEVTKQYAGKLNYSKFDDWYIGLHFNVGAQYKQFVTWFDINFMPTQVSERPSDYYATTTIDDPNPKNANMYPLYDVRWFAYGTDWMFGWKLLGENSVLNIIPAVGLGFNLINFHLASNFDLDGDGGSTVSLRDRYYSTIAATFNSELEIRLELGQFAIGAYGGYRYIRYNELSVEGKNLEPAFGKYDTDNVGDTWFIGLRLTWIFLSDWQSKEQDKL